MENKKRPLYITIIAWILILNSGFGLIIILKGIVTDFKVNNPIGTIQFILMIACGIGFLKGGNWSRFLFPILMIFSFAFALTIVPNKTMLFPKVIIYVVLAAVMFTKDANQYFKKEAIN